MVVLLLLLIVCLRVIAVFLCPDYFNLNSYLSFPIYISDFSLLLCSKEEQHRNLINGIVVNSYL